MDSRSLSLSEFIAAYSFWGDWEVSYTDGTHLQPTDYVKIGDITIDYSESITLNYPILPFTFWPSTSQQIRSRFAEIHSGQKPESRNAQKLANRAEKIVRDQLADSMIRTGLLRPDFCLMQGSAIEMGFPEVMGQLSECKYLILVVDTSALRRGVASFLHKMLSGAFVWTIIPVFVMTEVQRQAEELKRIWNKIDEGGEPHLGKCDVLEKRPQVSCISRELNWIQRWRPVEILTTLTEHLGQFDGQARVDRLIIESVKNLKRERGVHESVYLLTGDKDMASLAKLENVNSLHIDVPSLPTELSSVRYDSHNGRLLLSPVHYLLWDLAQVFSVIRIHSASLNRRYELTYYSEGRGGFFAYDVMQAQEF